MARPASRTASQLTDLADQVPPNAPARVPALPRREPLAGRPAPAKRASIFRKLSRNWDSVYIGRLAVEYEKPNIGPHLLARCGQKIAIV
jgi:hypothetical protein